MSRYIDAEWLSELFPDTGEGEWTYNATALGYIDSAPSIDLVRCGECKYRKNRIDYEKDYCIKHSKVIYNTDGYCSEGEREGE